MQQLEKMSEDEMRKLGLTGDVWKNDLYQVIRAKCRRSFEGRTVVSLSIKRHDRKPITDWHDNQQIKNELAGCECEGLELYPAESRLHDQINAYHLWVIEDPTYRLPIGWEERAVSNDDIQGEIEPEC